MRFIWMKIALNKWSLNSPDSNCGVLDIMQKSIKIRILSMVLEQNSEEMITRELRIWLTYVKNPRLMRFLE